MAARPARDRETTRLRGAIVLSVVLHLVLFAVVELLPVREAGENRVAQRLAVTMESALTNGAGEAQRAARDLAAKDAVAQEPAESADPPSDSPHKPVSSSPHKPVSSTVIEGEQQAAAERDAPKSDAAESSGVAGTRVAASRALPELVTQQSTAQTALPHVERPAVRSADAGESRAARDIGAEASTPASAESAASTEPAATAPTGEAIGSPGPSGAGEEPGPITNGVHVDAVVADLYRRLQDHLVYPMAARRRNAEGTVTVTIEVQADGSLGSHEVAGSSGHTVLDRAALESLQRVFPIVHSAGRPLRITVRIQYSLT